MKKTVLTLVCGWLALMGLLALQIVLASAPLGSHHLTAALAIAAVMATIVLFCFMELAITPPLAVIFAYAGVFWVLVLFGLSGVEYATRTTYAVSPTPAASPPR